ncbi:MAG: methyltransferase domain-containing protein [Chloroflexota bacterium]
MSRIDYDQIAPSYDAQPYRQKTVDENFIAFCEEHDYGNAAEIKALDLGCGTGNQLVANFVHRPETYFVGADYSYGMLKQAQPKSQYIRWVQCDNTAPPFSADTFHFISNQFSYHHLQDKQAMFDSVARLLNSGGRFILTNLTPEAMTGWLYYHYFPATYDIDQQHFLATDTLISLMAESGFVNIQHTLNKNRFKQNLQDFAQQVEARGHCSQLTAISDQDYQAGLKQLADDIAGANGEATLLVDSEVCVLSLRGDKP